MTTDNNVLPLCQAIRSPRYRQADEIVERHLLKRRVTLFCAMAFMMIGFLGITTSTADIIPEYIRQSKLRSSPLLNEPNIFTPRVVLEAIENSEQQLRT
mmetsp:Transcript_18630/g.27616  ORF Transcript_18630/g.27616 Transcript_18630/m.27616 type:complete len:99 (-) Transcript_18630:363-659(-)